MSFFSPILFAVTLISACSAYCQTDEANSFHLSGEIIGKDTGRLGLSYLNSRNVHVSDSAFLQNGKFSFSGQVNSVTDAYLWTEPGKKFYDHPSVIRFLLEPGEIKIVYNKPEVVITGSKAQAENEDFDSKKSGFVLPIKKMNRQIFELADFPDKMKTPSVKFRIDSLFMEIAMLNKRLIPIDLAYIKQNPDSYVSAFLLSKYSRLLSLDTVQAYYTRLSDKVKSSSVAFSTISYVYAKSNDEEFRRNNPLNDKVFDEQLRNIKSIHDFTLTDNNGADVDFNQFKGKYLLIDFWASWCSPCIAYFPFMEKLMITYKDDPINFIGVSVDADRENWKAAIAKYDPKGMQFWESKSFVGLLPVYCKVTNSLPTYVLVDPAGNIVNYSTPFPASADLKVLLDEHLKKSK